MISLSTIGALLFYGIALLAHLYGWGVFSRNMAFLGVLANGSLLAALSISSKHLPVFNMFENMMATAFVLGVLGIFSRLEKCARWCPATWVWLQVLFVVGISLLFPWEPASYRVDSDFLWVVLFHGLRVVALGTGLFAAAHFIPFRFGKGDGSPGKALFLVGRSFLLVTTVLFLSSEYAGMIWCQSGWGDFWHWNGTFLKSTLIIVCFMFALHIPEKKNGSEGRRSVAGLAAVFLMLAVRISKGLWMP